MDLGGCEIKGRSEKVAHHAIREAVLKKKWGSLADPPKLNESLGGQPLYREKKKEGRPCLLGPRVQLIQWEESGSVLGNSSAGLGKREKRPFPYQQTLQSSHQRN